MVFPNKLVGGKQRNIVEIELDGKKRTKYIGHLNKVAGMATSPNLRFASEEGTSPILFRSNKVPQPPLKFKLFNKGGMCEPALESKDQGSDEAPAKKDRNYQQAITRE